MTTKALPSPRRFTPCPLCDEDINVGDLVIPRTRAHESCVRAVLPRVDDAARARAARRQDVIVARFNGRCKFCGGETTAGSLIVRGDWCHPECKEAMRPELARHDAETVARQLSEILNLSYGEIWGRGKHLWYADSLVMVPLSDDDVDRLLSAKNPERVLRAILRVRVLVESWLLPVLR